MHPRNRYRNSRLEQDHRGIKRRSCPLRGFRSFEAAARFWTAHDELHDSFQSRRMLGTAVSLAERRQMFRDRWSALVRLLAS